MVTQARLQELFLYDNGNLVRRVSVKGSNAGTVIGTRRAKGYFVAMVDGKSYRVHHLVWMYHHGHFVPELDHINRDRGDNRIENLRPCTHSQNLGNSRARVHKYKGVTFCKATEKWRAQMNGHLGRFDTIEEAALAYNAAAIEHFGEFAHLNKVT
jgi:HNH endonuclease/AP2 domain